ncbi:MAG: hypothetical protein HYY17_13320 [Planctomycetes bacterium]|nr:hypothetical protein [Planctomycetota bacterium]
MNAGELKRFVARRPFVPIRITLHAGDPIDVRHPENIIIREHWVFVLDDPMPPIFFQPDMVVSVKLLRNGGARRRP